MISAVCGLIYDDEYKAKYGMNKIYYLNGDIEVNGKGETVYITDEYNKGTGTFVDVTARVADLPEVVKRFIHTHTQRVTDRSEVKCIGVHSSELM